jgi:hypothetical protein
MPTDERRRILERNALKWARVVGRVANRLSIWRIGDQLAQVASGTRTSDEWLIDAHLCGVGFRQIEQHLIHMRPYRTDALGQSAEAYLQEYGSREIKRLRDMLEHAAEYIAEAPTAKRKNLHYVPGSELTRRLQLGPWRRNQDLDQRVWDHIPH